MKKKMKKKMKIILLLFLLLLSCVNNKEDEIYSMSECLEASKEYAIVTYVKYSHTTVRESKVYLCQIKDADDMTRTFYIRGLVKIDDTLKYSINEPFKGEVFIIPEESVNIFLK
jgi:hypothetical protein